MSPCLTSATRNVASRFILAAAVAMAIIATSMLLPNAGTVSAASPVPHNNNHTQYIQYTQYTSPHCHGAHFTYYERYFPECSFVGAGVYVRHRCLGGTKGGEAAAAENDAQVAGVMAEYFMDPECLLKVADNFVPSECGHTHAASREIATCIDSLPPQPPNAVRMEIYKGHSCLDDKLFGYLQNGPDVCNYLFDTYYSVQCFEGGSQVNVTMFYDDGECSGEHTEHIFPTNRCVESRMKLYCD